MILPDKVRADLEKLIETPTPVAAASTQPTTTADPHLRYVLDVTWPYETKVYPNWDSLTRYLRTHVLINNSSRTLSAVDTEALCLGLNFVLGAEFAPGCPVEMLETNSKRWVQSINRAIHSARRRDKILRETGATPKPRLRGVLESSGRLEQERSDWDPLPASRNEWVDQPFFKDFGDKIANYTLDGATIENESDHRAPLHESIRLLGNDKSIHILTADKGGATVIVDSCDYDREANRQLGDSKTYTELSKDEYTEGLRETSLTVKEIAARLLREGSISKNEHDTFLAKL